MTGYIFDHRKELESDVWLLPPMNHRVWQWLKYMVNHSEARIPNKDGTFTIIKPGQHATSYRHIAKGVGYYEGLKWKEPNPKTVKTILNWLESQGMISVKGNTNGTVVTVENWDLYQKESVKGNTKVTLKKHSLDTNNNDKEELKNDNNDNKKTFIPPTLETIQEYVEEKEYVIDPKFFFEYFEANNWINSKGKSVLSWKGTIVTWNKRELKNNPKAKPYKKPKKLARREDY